MKEHGDVATVTLVPWLKCSSCGALHVRGSLDSKGRPFPRRISLDTRQAVDICPCCGNDLEPAP